MSVVASGTMDLDELTQYVSGTMLVLDEQSSDQLNIGNGLFMHSSDVVLLSQPALLAETNATLRVDESQKVANNDTLTIKAEKDHRNH